jgi:cyanophycin synthetase
MLNPKNFNYLSTYFLGKEAEDRGIFVTKIINSGPLAKKSYLELKYKNHSEVIIGQRTSKTDCIAYWIQKNKELAKSFFIRSGINVAKSQVLKSGDLKEVVAACHKIKYPVVIKPISGIQGKDVYLGIDSDRKVLRVLKELNKKMNRTILVEKEFKGEEYRILATSEKFVAAIHRVPANVVGDGVHTIKQLITLKNKDPRRGEGHKMSLVKIKIDDIVLEYLKQHGKKLSTVPNKDEIVSLRPNSNISTGGDSYDVTDIVNPKVKKLAVKIIQSIPGLAFAGIDYLTKDITADPTKRNYIVIEVNDSPMLSMHHVPYSGKERNVAAVIIDQLFPETKKKK